MEEGKNSMKFLVMEKSQTIRSATCFLVISGVMIFCSHNLLAENGGVKIPKTIDLQKVYEGQRKEFTINLQNHTEKEVIVKEVFYKCPCFLKKDNFPFKVGASSEKGYHTILDSFRLKGKFKKKIYFFIDNEVYQVAVSGEVIKSEEPFLYLHKDYHQIERQNLLKTKGVYTWITRITNTGQEPLEIKEIKSPKEIKVILRERNIAPGKGGNLKIEVSKKISKENFFIEIKSNSLEPERRIAIEVK